MQTLANETERFAEIKAAVSAGLNRYNDQFLPQERERFPLALSVRDEAGTIVGGLIGELRLDWLYVDLLWIDETQRGQGVGKQLIDLAEREARAFGATHIHLWTWSFQAPDFYAAMGFQEVGRLRDHPRGHDSIEFMKVLA
jgi:GNAT superfamily N-acetyltransferase